MATQINLTAGSNTYAITVAPIANINVTISRSVYGQVSANSAVFSNFANFAGNVTNSAQPNITSLGILSGLVVAGNITPNANITYNLGNNTNRFNDLYLANSTIYLGNETISANATSVVMGNLTVTGNFQVGNLVANTANYANFSGFANVANAVAGANVSGEVSFAATANAVAGANVSGEVTYAATANAVAGANVSGEVTYAATANSVAVANVSGIGNIATINLNGNASTILYGNGVFAADASNGNANFASYAGVVTTNAQPNITSVGTLTSLTVSGNVSTPLVYNNGMVVQGYDYVQMQFSNSVSLPANPYDIGVGSWFYLDPAGATWQSNTTGTLKGVFLGNDGGVIANGNITGDYFIGNGSLLTDIVATSGNSNYANFAGTAYSVDGANVVGAVADANLALQVADNTQSNITSVGTLVEVNTSGNINFIGSSNSVIQQDYANGATTLTIYGGSHATLLSLDGLGDANLQACSSVRLTANTQLSPVEWEFGMDGNLTLPGGGGVWTLGANTAGLTANMSDPYPVYLGLDYTANVATLAANTAVVIQTNTGDPKTWTFDTTGNLVLPGNTFAINFANGSQAQLANANYANFAGTAYAVDGANVSGAVAYATTANAVAGANVSGEVTYAATANAVAGANVSGEVTYAATANAVAGANVSGEVSFAATANAVAGANVSGEVTYAATANSVAGANVSGEVTYAATANSVAVANVSGIGNIATINLNGNASTILYGNGVFAADASNGNANFASYAGVVTTNAQPNITSVGTLTDLNVSNLQIHLGSNAGITGQGANSIAIGTTSGTTTQGINAIAIGYGAANLTQGSNGIAIGTTSGGNSQGLNSIAIGRDAGNITQGANSVAIGWQAGASNQSANSIAIGRYSGNTTQGTGSVAIGSVAGGLSQGANAVALGRAAGYDTQGAMAIAIGQQAGGYSQGANAIAAGYFAANANQGGYSIALGHFAASNVQGANSIAIGTTAANTTQGANSIAIGFGAASNVQSSTAIAIGFQAGTSAQGANSIAIGYQSANVTQGFTSIAIGWAAGQDLQGANSIAIGRQAANLSQGANSLAIGRGAAFQTQGANAVALGRAAGSEYQGDTAVAIGRSAGLLNQGVAAIAIGFNPANSAQGANAIAIGRSAAFTAQGANSIAIGTFAGNANQGAESVAIGTYAGDVSQAVNTIILNATGAALDQTTANTFTVKPVRVASTSNALFYNSTTGEISYNAIGNIITVNLDGNASTVLYGNGVFAASAGGNGTPGGTNTQIQFNDANAFGGNTGFTFDKTTGAFAVPGTATLTGLTISNATGVVDFTTSANVTLGAVANLHISGGTANYVLQTNGSGTLTWVAQSGGGNASNIANGNSSVSIATSGGPVTTSVAGNANIIIATGTGVNVAGTLNTTGNVAFSGANISLGAIGNVKITGGANAEFIRTDGAGNLSFVSVAETLLVGTRVGPYTVPITNYTFIVTARTGNVTIYVN